MRPIDADALQKAMETIYNDSTCPLHIAAEIDQIIDCAPTVDDWIKCSERMPDMMADRRPESGWSDDLKPSDYVLCYTNFKRQIVAWYSHAYDEWTGVEEEHTYSRDEITHWMPLPKTPKEDDEDEPH